MIRGLISEGMPCVPIATDGEIWYTLLHDPSTKSTAFGSVAREPLNGLVRCVIIHKFNGGNNFDFRRKTVVFPESASAESFNDFGTFVMTPDNANLPEEGLFAGVSYLLDKAFDCFITTDIPDIDADTSLPEFSFRGVDTSETVKKILRVTFVPYSTALSRYDEGFCSKVVSRDQLFYDFINAIDNLGDYNGNFRPPKNCTYFSSQSRGCYSVGGSCIAMNYCTTGSYCGSGHCYGKVRSTTDGQCLIKDGGYVTVPTVSPATTTEHALADNGGEVNPTGVVSDVKSKSKTFKIIALVSLSVLFLFLIIILVGMLHRSERTK